MTSITVDELVARLREEGTRVTTARRLLIAALVGEASHPTAEELLITVRRIAPDVNASTVYRNLEELERLGVVIHSHLGHGAATYHLADGAHGHLVCERCDAAVEAPPGLFDAMARGAKSSVGFVLHPYHFAMLGLCAECAEAAATGNAETAGSAR